MRLPSAPNRSPILPATAAALLLLLAGCAGSRPPTSAPPPPASLEQVNRLLDGQWATGVLLDGRRLEAKSVHVRPGTTTYLKYGQVRTGVRTATIKRVEVRAGDRSTARNGFLLGAAPGVAVMGVGLGIAATAGPEKEPEDSGGWWLSTREAGALVALGGSLIALGGGFVGFLMGSTLDQGEPVVLYRGPVERYLPEPATGPLP